jgi:Domain of Unknown Function (DUF928)
MKNILVLPALIMTAIMPASDCRGTTPPGQSRQEAGSSTGSSITSRSAERNLPAPGAQQSQSDPKTTPAGNPPPTNSTPKPKRKVLDADLSGFDVSDSKSNQKVTTMLGGSRSAAIPSATLLAPRRAKFYGGSAVFEWTFAGHSEGYVFSITDDDETQLLKQEVKSTSYRFNTTAAKLEPGQTYYWRVQVLPNPLASEPSEFVVVTAEERQAIDKALAAIPATDPYQSPLARAKVLTDHRLWFDALGAYDDLIARFPGRAELYDQRGAIYFQLDATKTQAQADFAQADKSSK